MTFFGRGVGPLAAAALSLACAGTAGPRTSPHESHGVLFPSLDAHVRYHFASQEGRLGRRPLREEPGFGGYEHGRGALRTRVEPPTTEVYVNGYFAGVAADFDGFFERLYLDPGRHVLELRLAGHQVFRRTLTVDPGEVVAVEHRMEPAVEVEKEPPPARSTPSAPAAPSERSGEARPAPEPKPERPGVRMPRAPSRFGEVVVRVQPDDADVFIDGELWGNLEGLEEIAIHLPAGTHRIEIRREGYESFTTEVEIRPGESVPLNVLLE